jgi:hypothetical protein
MSSSHFLVNSVCLSVIETGMIPELREIERLLRETEIGTVTGIGQLEKWAVDVYR